MMLAGGLGLLGCVRMYRRRDLTAALILGGGVLVGLGARPYAGAAIAAAGFAVTLHASLRSVGPARRRAPRIAAACVVIPLLALAAAPTTEVFARLQLSQNANVSDQANLTLEPIDFSSPVAVARNLPRRVADFLLRPYPWQVGNLSQQFGVLGTLVAWLLFVIAGVAAVRRPRRLEQIVPALYLLGGLIVAYSLSAGNAGTGFRYRTHVVVLLAAVACALVVAAQRQRRTGDEPGSRAAMVLDRVLGERS